MYKTIPVEEAVGVVLPHDITEIRKDEFKGRAFKKGHVVKKEDILHLQMLGKENLYVIEIGEDEMHENDAAYALAEALAGKGVELSGEPVEGKINLIASYDGLLRVKKDALAEFNMLGEVMCATLHNNTYVRKGRKLAGTRAIPLVIKKHIIEKAVRIAKDSGGILEVIPLRKAKVGVVITGNEVYYKRVKDSFEPIIRAKMKAIGSSVLRVYFCPDDAEIIKHRIRELIEIGCDLIVTTGGMSVDPDDVTRVGISQAGATDVVYGSPVLPGAMFLIAYISAKERKHGSAEVKKFRDNSIPELPTFQTSEPIPILGIPACGMYHKTTIFDLILPRVLAGEKITRREISELGHGGFCLGCKECRHPVCPFGKGI
ncbi:MAG: molybdopterin-binding protein [Nitrospirota bacterium]